MHTLAIHLIPLADRQRVQAPISSPSILRIGSHTRAHVNFSAQDTGTEKRGCVDLGCPATNKDRDPDKRNTLIRQSIAAQR